MRSSCLSCALSTILFLFSCCNSFTCLPWLLREMDRRNTASTQGKMHPYKRQDTSRDKTFWGPPESCRLPLCFPLRFAKKWLDHGQNSLRYMVLCGMIPFLHVNSYLGTAPHYNVGWSKNKYSSTPWLPISFQHCNDEREEGISAWNFLTRAKCLKMTNL